MSAALAIAAALAAIAPPDVGSAAVHVGHPAATLWPQEADAVAAAVPARRAEFAAGRMAARRAMTVRGGVATVLPMGPDRVPVWPLGTTGSIAHSARIAVAVAGDCDCWAGLGVDLEPVHSVAAELGDMLGRPDEIAAAEGPGGALTRLFCAKEAIQKALWPQGRVLLEFRDVTLTRDGGSFAGRLTRKAGSVRSGTVLRGQWTLAADHLLAAVFWDRM